MADIILVLTVLTLFGFGGYLVDLADRFFAETADASKIETEEPQMVKVLVLNLLSDEELLKEIHQYQKEYQDAEILLYRKKDKKQIFDMARLRDTINDVTLEEFPVSGKRQKKDNRKK